MKKISTMLVLIFLSTMIFSACAQSANANSPSTSQGNADQSGGSVAINGAGSTFQQPVEAAWIYAYQSVDPSASFNYQGIGSGGGKKGIIDGTIDFAGTDSLLSADEYAAGKDLQMYPILAGAVIIIYNVDGITGVQGLPALVLDRQTLEEIYAAKITQWNDPAIVALNPGLADKLPASTITAVHRSDGSGTTEIFTNALSSFNQDWANNVGSGTSIEWPVDKNGNGIGGKGNQGVAAAVQNTPNSLGYVELSFAISNKIQFAQMVNKAGNTVTANAESLQSAMSDFAGGMTEQLTATIVDGTGANSWPISGYTYIILHTTSMQDCTKATKIVQFFTWALTDPGAAKTAADLGYATLPTAVQPLVLDKLNQVTCQGNPVMK